MKKFINFRFAFFVAVAIIASVILSSCVFVSQSLKLMLILGLLSVFLIFLVFFAFFRKRSLIVASIVVLISIVPAVSIYFISERINNNNKLISETCTFSGKIYSISEDLDRNAIFLYLSNVKIIEENDTNDFYGKMYVRLNANNVDTSKLEIGRFVTFHNANVSCLSLCEDTNEFSRSFISNGITATSYVYAFNLELSDKVSLSLRDRIKNSVYDSFKKTDTFFTDIGFAVIFGESKILEDEVYGVFKDGGIAHLLAVSGFHISVIVAFLSFILDKLKAKKAVKILIISVLLGFYAYLCSYSISVIRASLMAIMLLYAGSRNKEYDRLSALSLVAILILLISPMQLFSVSFIFSFISILSIILLMPIFERLFSKVFAEKFSSSLSISLAVCLGVLVFQLYYFKSYPIFSIFSNLITIPLVGALFIFLLISVIVGSIFNVTVPLINAFGFCMKYIVQFNNWIVSNGFFLTCENFGAIALLLSIVTMFAVSDYTFMKKKLKLSLTCVLLFALVVVIMI